MTLDELTQDKLEHVFKLIREAYEDGEVEVVLKADYLSVAQFYSLGSKYGYKIKSELGKDVIYGWL